MAAYIARRFLWTVVLVLVITAVTFLIFYVLPTADPAALRAGRSPSPDLIKAIRYWLGLVALYLFANDIGVWHVFPGSGAYQDAHGFFHKCWTLVMPWCVLAAA